MPQTEEGKKPQFKHIFVVEPSGHDFEQLKQYTGDIVFITSGYEQIDELPKKIAAALSKFNPLTDAFVPVGKLISTLLAGMAVGRILKQNDWSEVWVGIYREKDYKFMAVGEIEQ
jgi:hypothetical protein